jgi:hypothetical protein
MTVTISESAITSLLKGAIHLNCRNDIVDTARAAQRAEMGALVFQDHGYSPTPTIAMLRRHEFADGRLQLVSGVTLNNTVGGLNPFAVEHELMLGGRIISMPTLSAANRIRQAPRSPGAALPARPAIEVLDASGHLLDAVKEILDIIAERGGVLASGALHISEIWPLFTEARQRGVTHLLANCPTFLAGAGLADIRELAAMGVFIEQRLSAITNCAHFGAAIVRAAIASASVAQTIISPPASENAVEGYRRLIGLMLELGYGESELRQMTSANARRLLGLEEGTMTA